MSEPKGNSLGRCPSSLGSAVLKIRSLGENQWTVKNIIVMVQKIAILTCLFLFACSYLPLLYCKVRPGSEGPDAPALV